MAIILELEPEILELVVADKILASGDSSARESLTVSQTISVASSKHYTNAGATDTVVATLPASASIGSSHWCAEFFVTVAEILRIKAQGSDVIRYTTAVSAAAGSLESSEIGSCIKIAYVGGGVFFVTQAMDAWEFA